MRPRLIRLNSSHFVVLLTGVALVMFIIASLWEPWLREMYASEIGLPAMEKRYGFTWGTIRLQRDGLTPYGIVNLDRNGLLAQRGLQQHDAPWLGDAQAQGRAGAGSWAFYYALRAVDRGEAVSIDVLNWDEYIKGMRTLRRIELSARR